ncbi:MAG: hypothetical protein SGPRY_011332 [Prymnesium sp.]
MVGLPLAALLEALVFQGEVLGQLSLAVVAMVAKVSREGKPLMLPVPTLLHHHKAEVGFLQVSCHIHLECTVVFLRN